MRSTDCPERLEQNVLPWFFNWSQPLPVCGPVLKFPDAPINRRIVATHASTVLQKLDVLSGTLTATGDPETSC